jgi:N-acyl amino acid synthase FeeM
MGEARMKSVTAWVDVPEQLQLHATAALAAVHAPAAPAVRRATVHGSIHPADVRPGDPISARARLSAARDRDEAPVQVWRISPLGVELVRSSHLANACAGDRIDVALQLGFDRVRFSALEIVSAHEEHGRTLLAARWCGATEQRGERERRRIGARWRCRPEYLPTGIAPCAVRYADFVHFRIVEISRHGMQLLTSVRNKFLVPGTTLEATCSFPTLEQVTLSLRVVRTRVVDDAGRPALSMGVTWETRGTRAAETVGQYLLQFSPGATPGHLRSEGLPVHSMSRAFDFAFVTSAAEYAEVLALRKLAYVHAKKVSADAPDVQMGDEFDAQSRIITARHQGRLVGSTRVVFARTDGDRLKHDDYVKLPSWLPPRTELIESSKTCTHPDFRGNDLFASVLKQMAIVTLGSGRRWLLMSCTDSLRPLYKKLGCKDVGVTYVHPTMKLRHHVMIGDVVSMVCGGMNPIAWHFAIGTDLWRFAKRCGVVPRSFRLEAKVRLIRCLAPVAALVERTRRRAERSR